MPARILVVDDEPGLREILRILLTRSGHEVEVAEGETGAAEAMARAEPPFDVVITDLAMPDGSGMGVMRGAKARDETTEVIMITAYATTEQAVLAMREGAYDYVQKPFKNDSLLATVEKALEKRNIVSQNRTLRATLKRGFQAGDVVGKSQAMRQVMDLVARVANAPTSVLITGESGTGKEMIARALHQSSERRERAFVAINCAALPEALLESELFGHEKGAFTGATQRKEGLFRTAHHGTLFLDEVGELPLALQVKLLRALQERRIRPVGGQEEQDVTVRVVAATNRDVAQEVAEGRFREDLFYRLNVINLHLPPLRERPEDIPLLAEHFLRKHGSLQGKQLTLSAEATRWLAAQTYKGNVRELENVVERAVTLALREVVSVEDLTYGPGDSAPAPLPPLHVPEEGLDLDARLAEIERSILLAALERSGGVRKDAAGLLRMTFRSFRYRLAKYGLGDGEPEDS